MLTIVGLGPGPLEMITGEARQALAQASRLYLRTSAHPAAPGLLSAASYSSFDHLYHELPDPGAVWRAVVGRVVALAQAGGDVTYAVPGNPVSGEATAPAILGACRELGLPVRVLPGIDIADVALPRLGLDLPPAGLQVVDAHEPRLDAAQPALVAHIFNAGVLSHLRRRLDSLYPPEHPVMVVPLDGGAVQETKLAELAPDVIAVGGHGTPRPCCLYLPSVAGAERLSDFGTLMSIMARLRGPSGCPWDRQQSHASLRPNLLEESYEVLQALDEADTAKLSEELGDLLMQIAFHCQIASERGEFQVGDVLRHINAKLLRRHPHIFGPSTDSGRRQATVKTADEVAVNWEHIKRQERGDKGSLLEGIPGEMPALAASQSIQRRVAQVGFDWKDLGGVLGKLSEEVAELSRAGTPQQRELELGDVLFSLANVGRWLGIDPEAALRVANRRFAGRFAYMEEACRRRGLSLAGMSLEQQNELWEEAKRAAGE